LVVYIQKEKFTITASASGDSTVKRIGGKLQI